MKTFNLADLFEVVVDAVPDRDALVAGEARRTYAELDERANRVANHLIEAGVGAGDHVGIQAWNCAEWVEVMLGCFKARAVPINVNYRYVEDELLYLFDNADLLALFVARDLRERVDAVRPELPALRHVVVFEDDYEDALATVSGERPALERSPDDPYVLYTGGTTGMPKGTVWRSEDIFMAAMGGGNFGGPPIARPEELADKARQNGLRYLVCAPMMHGGGQWVSFICFYGGGTVILYTGRHFDAGEVWALAERERAQSVMIVGDAMGRPLAESLEGGRYDLSSLRGVGSGGAILSKTVKEQLRERLPGVVVTDSFGASESGASGAVLDFDGPAAGPHFTMAEHTTVLDGDLQPVAPGSGVIGRLARKGHIPLGYHKDPSNTAATFVERDGVRWVLPGDFATVEADGTVTLLGRGSVSINSGGEKIFPEEVEAALKSHPDVFDAVVVGVPDDRFGEQVAAVVQARPGTSPALDALAAHCRTKVAGYKVPRRLVLVEEVERTPAAKPDYRWAKEVATKT